MNTQAQNALPLETSNNTSVQAIAAKRALDLLKALKAKYVILLTDGTVIEEGGLELKPVKVVKERTRHPADPTVPYGTYTRHLKEQGLDKMAVGDVISVDPLTFPIESVRGTAGAWAVKAWGKESVITAMRNGLIEIMRVK